VHFFETAQQALQHGFRPCKICRPMELDGSIPHYIKNILDELEDKPFFKIKD
jgi:AraC family transcriptional regulator of adaptative response/methylated-DNA-[protein]-cysteine methyltransferase